MNYHENEDLNRENSPDKDKQNRSTRESEQHQEVSGMETVADSKNNEPVEGNKKKGKGNSPAAAIILIILVAVLGFIFFKYFYKNIRQSLVEKKYYADGKKDLEMVSMEPPSGFPFDPLKTKYIKVKFNHPVNPESLERGVVFPHAGMKANYSWLSDDNTIINVPAPSPYYDAEPRYFYIKDGITDSRGHNIKGFVCYNFRNSNPSKDKYSHGNILEILDTRAKYGLESINNMALLNRYKAFAQGFEDPYHSYQILRKQSKPIFIDRKFYPLTLYNSHRSKWNSSYLRDHLTLFVIGRADGTITSPGQMDIIKTVRKYYSPKKLKIVYCYISVDRSQLKYAQKDAGKDILVLSDLQGCRGPVFNSLVHTKNLLPLSFFIDGKGYVKEVFTGLLNVKGVVDNCEKLGVKTNLPQPDKNKVKEIQKIITQKPDDYKNYMDLAELYKSSGNAYQASLYYYQALRYNNDEEKLRRQIYDRFCNWGMYKEAVDLYIEAQPGNPADAEKFYLAAEAAMRMGHPDTWGYNPIVENLIYSGEICNPADGRINLTFLRLFTKAETFAYWKKSGFVEPEEIALVKRSFKNQNKIKTREENSKKKFPGNIEPFRIVASYALFFGEYKWGYTEMEKAKKLKGFNNYDRGRMAELAARIGKFGEAYNLALTALKTTSSANAHFALGLVYIRKGDYNKAADELDKALALQQWEYEYYELYSKVLKKQGQTKKALRMKKFANFLRGTLKNEPVSDIKSGDIYY